MGAGQGGPPGGGSGRRGGGGGGGGFDPLAEFRERMRLLEQQKVQMREQLAGARNQALPLIDQYGREATQNVTNVFNQNQAQTGALSKQLGGIRNMMTQGAQGSVNALQRDIYGQGGSGGGPEMMAMLAAARQNQLGTDFLGQNADAFNQRLAQMMSGARADALSTAGTVTQSGRSRLEAEYMNALSQIGLLGLT